MQLTLKYREIKNQCTSAKKNALENHFTPEYVFKITT
jgi:hypothetical protein